MVGRGARGGDCTKIVFGGIVFVSLQATLFVCCNFGNWKIYLMFGKVVREGAGNLETANCPISLYVLPRYKRSAISVLDGKSKIYIIFGTLFWNLFSFTHEG